MAAMSDYERRRLENIKKNQSLLSSLAIESIAPSRKNKRPVSSAPVTPASKRRRQSAPETAVPPKRHATRASVRLSGIGLVELKAENEVANQQEPEIKINQAQRHLDRKLIVENWRAKDPLNSSELTTGLIKCVSSCISPQSSKTIKQEELNFENDKEVDQLRLDLANMRLRSLNRVCPNRIYSMAFHPDPQKSLLFIGEKLGGVAIWDALNSNIKTEDDDKHFSSSVTKQPAEEKNEAEEDEELEYLEGQSYFIQAHARFSAVSAIQPHPNHSHLIYTSSYDCSIRELNFETQQSTEVIDGDSLCPSVEALISAFEFANEGREIWCSDIAGGLSHRDLRQPKSTSRRWAIAKKKIGCVSLGPNSNGRLAVTAGLNREMRLWDLAALSGLPTDSDLSLVESRACLLNYPHRLACSSAYFNHTGDKILSTSYDDTLRVWELDSITKDGWLSSPSINTEFKPKYQARHDNQTGRWVSVMKARWCPNPRLPSHFTVGNMTQKLDIYTPKGELLTQFKHHALTAVPAVTAQHPNSTTNQIAGGTAGGKVYLWM